MDRQSEFGNLSPAEVRVILDSIVEGVFTVDREMRITSFNRAAEEISGIDREEAVGRPCCEVLRAGICESDCTLKSARETGKPVVGRRVHIFTADGERIPVSVSASELLDENGNVIGGVETFRDLSVEEELRRRVEDKYTYFDIVSRNRKMGDIFAVLPEIAASDVSVLIQGASGTGKELVARALHDLSGRKEGLLVVVNCAALPDTLLESELFGYRKGAFTGAATDKPGRLDAAAGGTMFLDEIGDISKRMQVKLLRLLQEKTFEPLGGNEPRKADVRFVFATNRDLREEVRAGRFREDLFYRVNVVELNLPPLRDRMEDVPLLADHFIERLNLVHDRRIAGLTDRALALFMAHDWPGNVRELENAIEHAFILCRDDYIDVAHLPAALREKNGGDETPAPHRGSMEEREAAIIRETLARHSGSRKKTAEELKIGKSTLWRKMKRYGLF